MNQAQIFFSAMLLASCRTGPSPVEAVPIAVSIPRPVIRQATAAPADDAIYFVMIDRFANGDPANDQDVDRNDPQAWHGGDLRGLIDHLDWIAELGFRTVWITPVSRSRQTPFHTWGAFHGYWVTDPTSVEPRFGILSDLQELSDALHQRDMRLVLDIVYNHVDYESPLVNEHPEWFHESLPIEDWDDPWQRVHHEVHGLPDLAQEHPEVSSWLRDVSIQWLVDVGPDGFRVDAVRHLPTEFSHSMVETLHDAAGSGFTVIGEIFDGDPLHLSTQWQATGFDAVFDFPLHYAMTDVFCKGRSLGRLASVLSMDRLYAAPEHLVTFLDNHDVGRIRSACGEDNARVALALDFQLTARGTPSMTWGTETGLRGAEEPLNRADMVFGDGPHVDRVRKLLALRRSVPALTSPVSTFEMIDEQVLFMARLTSAQAALVGINLTDHDVGFTTPEWFRFGEHRVVWGEGQLEDGLWVLPPRSVGILVADGREGSFATRVSHAESWPSWTRVVELQATLPPGDGTWVISGAGSELGNWDPHAGIPFERGRATIRYPIQGVLEYKLVWLPNTGEPEWERGDNRFLLVRAAERPLIKRLGSPRQ